MLTDNSPDSVIRAREQRLLRIKMAKIGGVEPMMSINPTDRAFILSPAPLTTRDAGTGSDVAVGPSLTSTAYPPTGSYLPASDNDHIRANPLQFAPAFTAGLHPLAILSLALRALPGSPSLSQVGQFLLVPVYPPI